MVLQRRQSPSASLVTRRRHGTSGRTQLHGVVVVVGAQGCLEVHLLVLVMLLLLLLKLVVSRLHLQQLLVLQPLVQFSGAGTGCRPVPSGGSW